MYARLPGYAYTQAPSQVRLPPICPAGQAAASTTSDTLSTGMTIVLTLVGLGLLTLVEAKSEK